METRPILKNRVFLYLTEFFAGMSVMAVELGASRLLAPYFSSSQIVWTIIIGTIMIAMALGNIYGGRAADKNPNPDRLYARIIIAAIWIAAIPVLGKYIIILISGLLIFTVSNNFLVIAGFVACMVIFVFPLFLLGTVTPSLVKYTVDNLDNNGKLVGNLNAFNTIGSIIGTFVPTFISIPAVGTSITFLIFAGILFILCAVYFISSKVSMKKIKRLPVGMFIFILCVIFGHRSNFAFWQKDLLFEGESIYNYLQVYEDDRARYFSTNVLFGIQSVYLKEKGLTGYYYDFAMAAPFMTGVNEKDSLDILILGNGTGTFATQCERYFDKDLNIIGVEIDEKITELAREYFELPEDVEVVTYDGRAYLNAVDEKYDVIMVDAYQDITIPFQMSSEEFFSLVKDHLKDGGVMVVNMNMKSGGEGSINEYLSDTISSVFSEVYYSDTFGVSNREVFASDNPEMLRVFAENVEKEEDYELSWMMDQVSNRLVEYNAGDYVMTDDKAPVELLGMKVIDELIQAEVSYYKEIFKEGGIKAVIEML
ncbi:MAG: fused MFS/spermidine synthase [Lachnospiraceae bacterium]|nr:fused MFS/spermidine synthase [Lachnospiraceae bacterium]